MTRNVVVNIGVVIAGVVIGAAISVTPWRVFHEEKKAADAQISEMHKSESKREDDLKRESRLRTSVGQEELARENGWLGPGETKAPAVDGQ